MEMTFSNYGWLIKFVTQVFEFAYQKRAYYTAIKRYFQSLWMHGTSLVCIQTLFIVNLTVNNGGPEVK